MLLQGKKILLGVCGGIAAYKTPYLVRLLKKQGADVRCVCTPAALQFVTPLTLETVSGHAVYSDLFAPKNEVSTAHVAYADWADFLIVAPATANTLAKFARGLADNALSTLFNAYTPKRVMVAPAMNAGMYRHPATQANLQTLREWGVHVMEPASGFLACGGEDIGRMREPEEILQRFLSVFYAENGAGAEDSVLRGKKVLVTAGATVEDLDPVRYITNRSTGYMGCCLVDALSREGAQVYLVCGEEMRCRPRIAPHKMLPVRSAEQMYKQCVQLWPQMDIGILSAAVADYTPQQVSAHKIKKSDTDLNLALVRTRDILKTLGQSKQPHQILAGFALETQNETENALKKLHEKNADLIVLNSLAVKGAGFGGETNKITVLDKNGGRTDYPLVSKIEAAQQILENIKPLC